VHAPDAVAIALAGIRAVDARAITRAALERGIAAHPRGEGSRERELVLVAIGKAAVPMAGGAMEVLGDRVARAITIGPPGSGAVVVGGHPIPSEEGRRGAAVVATLARELEAEDVLVCLLSGGASSLAMLPVEGIVLADVQRTTELLMRAGAPIGELNCVRKHLDQLKGGRLARLAAPATVIGLVLSDVVGDPLDVIASGPLTADPSTFADAIQVLHAREVWEETPAAVRAYLEAGARGAVEETPKPGDPCFARVRVEIIGSNAAAVEGARVRAASLGYHAAIATTRLGGEARVVGESLAELALQIQASLPDGSAPVCRIAGGETTVTVHGAGRGGRNQELALAAALVLEGTQGIVVASVGTDGVDGPTDAAGAWADGHSVERGRTNGVDARRALEENDSHAFWRAADGLVVTGPTGTNVMDLVVVTIRR
jgi:hydroxypyruvate reductase